LVSFKLSNSVYEAESRFSSTDSALAYVNMNLQKDSVYTTSFQ